ncbi:hypothetical protein [Myroides odoratus]|uniref:hypothetical protein n=1 Tax=Myroides odoratus TaxID=256 RepID=UPI003341E2EE
MSAKNTAKEKAAESEATENKEKICFVVMPISDQEGYEKGHFKRVYEHLIKPAVIKAGLTPVRADDEYKTNNIVLDIIRKIIESDHVICDLSAKNANVFYELGMRQAFDKSITLIKDNKTPRVFDVSGIRTIDYDENLRIDNVQIKIDEIANSIIQTLAHHNNDSIENSVIKQLAIKAAEPATVKEISLDTQLILDRLTQLEIASSKNSNSKQQMRTNVRRNGIPIFEENGYEDILNVSIHGKLYTKGLFLFKNNENLGLIKELSEDYLVTSYHTPSGSEESRIIPLKEIEKDKSYYPSPF